MFVGVKRSSAQLGSHCILSKIQSLWRIDSVSFGEFVVRVMHRTNDVKNESRGNMGYGVMVVWELNEKALSVYQPLYRATLCGIGKSLEFKLISGTGSTGYFISGGEKLLILASMFVSTTCHLKLLFLLKQVSNKAKKKITWNLTLNTLTVSSAIFS